MAVFTIIKGGAMYEASVAGEVLLQAARGRQVITTAKLVLLLFACAPLAAVSQQSGAFQAERTGQIAGTIQSVRQSDRHVTLLRSDGTSMLVEAGSGVKNLNELKPGDKVVVIYQEALIAEIGTRGGARIPDVPPEAGQQPMPAGKTPVTGTVRVESIDTSEHTITFVRADGARRKLTVMRPDAKRFIETLKPGDEVDVTYREPLALSIEPNKD